MNQNPSLECMGVPMVGGSLPCEPPLQRFRKEKPAFSCRLLFFEFTRQRDYEQVVPQLLQADGSHEGALGSVLISTTCTSKVRVFPARG